MPAPVVSWFIGYIQTQLQIEVWDGEVPRQDEQGRNIRPTDAGEPAYAIPNDWPAFTVEMTESGMDRTHTFVDPYGDEGPLVITIWDVTRAGCETTLDRVDTLLSNCDNWPNIAPVGAQAQGLPNNPYYVYSCLLLRWTCVQEKDANGQARVVVKTDPSGAQNFELLYRGTMQWQIGVHGAVRTTRN